MEVIIIEITKNYHKIEDKLAYSYFEVVVKFTEFDPFLAPSGAQGVKMSVHTSVHHKLF